MPAKGAALLLAVGLVGTATQMKAQSIASPASRREAPPMSKFRLPSRGSSMPCKRATKPCKSALSSWNRS